MVAEGINEKGLWEPITAGRANHGWDCSVLIMAAREILGVKFWPRPDSSEAQQSEGRKSPHDDKTEKARILVLGGDSESTILKWKRESPSMPMRKIKAQSTTTREEMVRWWSYFVADNLEAYTESKKHPHKLSR